MLLWIDAALNLLIGVSLLAFPPPLVRALGLPETKATFYPRVFGGVLIGVAIALWIEALVPTLGGLGLGGAIAINMCGAAVVSGCLINRQLIVAPKGRLLLWSVVVALVVLSTIELWVV